MYKLQTGVPIPPIRRHGRPRKYNFDAMVVGHMFFAVGKTTHALSPYVSAVARRLKRKFLLRQTTMIQSTNSDWSECPPDAVGAIAGVAVWRTY